MKHFYIEVVSIKGDHIVKRIDVTGRNERSIDKVEAGLNINLAHDLYYTRINEYDTKQELEPATAAQ